MDQFDIAILDLLQIDNQISQRTIADRIGLSAAAVQRRIKRMRENGTIKREVAILNPKYFGDPITILVEVTLENEKIELIDQAKRSFVESPEVQQCYYVTGETDFFLVIVVQSMSKYEEVTRRLFFGNENIKSFRSLIAMGIEKQGFQLPLMPNRKDRL
jgi:transcriptional regulator, AsnC family